MLKLKPNPRELVLLLVLVALSIGVAWYYLLFTPLNNSLLSLKDQLNKGQQQLAERKEWQLRDAETSELLQKLLGEQTELQAQFDPISHVQDVINYCAHLLHLNSGSLSSLELKPEQVAILVSVPNYGSVRRIVDHLEKSPNFVLGSAQITNDPGSGNYSLKLQTLLFWGQRMAGAAEQYSRTTPFGG